MASLQKVGSKFHLFFRFGNGSFKPSLKTTSEKDAETAKARVEETIRLLDTGRIAIPPKATRKEVLQFILSGGTITERPVLFNGAASPTLATVVGEYLADYMTGKAEKTVSGERIHLNHLKRLLGPDTPFSDEELGEDRLRKYITARSKENGIRGGKLSPGTIDKEFRTFKQLWKAGRAKGYISQPFPKITLDKIEEQLPFMTWDQIEAIIKRGGLKKREVEEHWDCLFLDEKQVLQFLDDVKKQVKHPYIHVALAIAAFTGARRSEVMASRISDWKLESGVVHIRGRKDSRRKKMVFRSVPIHPQLRTIIDDWLEVHPGSPYMVAVPLEFQRSKIKAKHPVPMNSEEARKSFEEAVAGTKWAVMRGWHLLRHSFCSNCARRNIPDNVIDAWMGHKGDEAIKKRYRHLFPCDERRFMDALSRQQRLPILLLLTNPLNTRPADLPVAVARLADKFLWDCTEIARLRQCERLETRELRHVLDKVPVVLEFCILASGQPLIEESVHLTLKIKRATFIILPNTRQEFRQLLPDVDWDVVFSPKLVFGEEPVDLDHK